MNKVTQLSIIIAALLATVVMGKAYADESVLTQDRTQLRERSEVNLQAPSSESGQARFRETKKVMQKNKHKNQYKYQNEYQKDYQKNSGFGSMSRNSMMNRQPSSGGSRGGGGRR